MCVSVSHSDSERVTCSASSNTATQSLLPFARATSNAVSPLHYNNSSNNNCTHNDIQYAHESYYSIRSHSLNQHYTHNTKNTLTHLHPSHPYPLLPSITAAHTLHDHTNPRRATKSISKTQHRITTRRNILA